MEDLSHPSGVPDPELLDRVEAALDGLAIFGHDGRGQRTTYGNQLAEEADAAGCPEVAMLARMAVAGSSKLDLDSIISLTEKALAERRVQVSVREEEVPAEGEERQRFP